MMITASTIVLLLEVASRLILETMQKQKMHWLLFWYYVWDLSYPKQYQLLGFLQT